MKLLAIDIGNSKISTRFFKLNRQFKRVDFPTNEFSLNNISKLITEADFTFVSSVVPAISNLLLKEKGDANLHLLTCKDIPLKSNLKNIERVGTDRLINSFAAFSECKCEVVVVGMGTATIVEGVTGEGEYIGGMILPGVATMLKSLSSFTAQLPDISFNPIYSNIGVDTQSAMRLGVQCATLGGIEFAVNKMKETIPNAVVYVTGGWSRDLGKLLPFQCEIKSDLTLQGIFKCGLNIIASSTVVAYEPYDAHISSSQQLESRV